MGFGKDVAARGLEIPNVDLKLCWCMFQLWAVWTQGIGVPQPTKLLVSGLSCNMLLALLVNRRGIAEAIPATFSTAPQH